MAVPEKQLGKRVAALRKASGLTQERLASKVDVVVETISRLERGESIPSPTRLQAIASALEVELAELFRFRVKPSPKDAAIDRLVLAVRRSSADEIEAVAEVVEAMLRAFGR